MKLLQLAFVLLFALPFVSALSVFPDGGFYPGNLELTLSGSEGNVIYYTTDGTNPLNGTPGVNGTQLNISVPSLMPSAFATNPETSLYGFPNPTSTMKGVVLRAVEVNSTTNLTVASMTRTYFLGMSYTNFTLPVFSLVLEDQHLQGYDRGMFVKGSTYYNDLATNGGNPTNPFRPANWNNDSDRFPAHVELYRDGVRFLNDNVMAYPSGRWSAALAKKSVKLKYDNAVGPAFTTVLLFGNQSPTTMNKIWLKQGGQDFNGLGMRDCIAAEIITDANLRVEETQCAQAILFINGEFYGVLNIMQDIDAKYYANRYGISKNDVVLIEQDNLVEEGVAADALPIIALRQWLNSPGVNLSDNTSWANFTAQVNVDGLIDHMIVQSYFNNEDYPNDYRIWRNKKNSSQVPGTMYDGRWQFQPKDLDQSAGLYPHIRYDENVLAKYMNESSTSYGFVFFKKAMENPEFRAKFVNRSFELVNGPLDSAHVNATVDRLAASRRPEVAKDFSRWQKPPSWENDLISYKNWMARRQVTYLEHVTLTIGGMNISLNQTNTTGNTTNTTVNITQVACYLNESYGYCLNSTLLSDVWSDGCRMITCGKNSVSITMALCNHTLTFPPINTTNGTNVTIPPINNTNGTLPPVNGTNTTNTTITCYNSILTVPVTCIGGNITSDVVNGGCRVVTCGIKVVQACDKSNNRFVLDHQTWNVPAAKQIRECFGPANNQTCIDTWGQISGTRPICG